MSLLLSLLRWAIVAVGFVLIGLYMFIGHIPFVALFIVLGALGWAMGRVASLRRRTKG